MSTGVESWSAESLAKMDAIYPFVGSEVLLTIVGVVIWIGWQIWQIKFENNSYDEQTSQLQGDSLTKAISEE